VDVPDGYEKIDAQVFRKGDELLVVGTLEPEGPFAFSLKMAPAEPDLGPPPAGFEWTGEVRPPKKDEWFWSDLKGQPVRAIEDETGVNRFGEPTGGRKILKPLARPERPKLRLVKREEEA